MTHYLIEIRGQKGTKGWKPYQVVDHEDEAMALAKTINSQGMRSRIELVRGMPKQDLEERA
jgi:hypothetical protein